MWWQGQATAPALAWFIIKNRPCVGRFFYGRVRPRHLSRTPVSQRVVKETIVTLDLEGVLVPEIWIAVAEQTGIETLRRTTRDEPDYDVLMRYRLDILDEHGLKLSDIQGVIDDLSPLPGAREFLDTLRARAQVIILSDTFLQFANPLMRQLGWPTLFCNHLEIVDDRVAGYHLRQPDQKRQSVLALKSLNYTIISAGDSYNDTTMLAEADKGILFRAPANVKAEFSQFPAVEEYSDLMAEIEKEL